MHFPSPSAAGMVSRAVARLPHSRNVGLGVVVEIAAEGHLKRSGGKTASVADRRPTRDR